MTTMNIADAITQWNKNLKAVTYEHPELGTQKITRVYFLTPPESKQNLVADLPAIIHDWSLDPVQFNVSLQIQFYEIHTQLIVHDTDWNIAADIATRFMKPIVDAWRADVTLSGTVTRSELRGGSPTLGGLPWAKVSNPSLEFYLRVKMEEGADAG